MEVFRVIFRHGINDIWLKFCIHKKKVNSERSKLQGVPFIVFLAQREASPHYICFKKWASKIFL